jgi:hypothetical protein
MQIDSKASLSGIRVTEIRSLFRKAGLDGAVSIDLIREELALNEREARTLLLSLQTEGFIERTEFGWSLTKNGIRLRAASAAKPLLRSTADRLLQELLGRIQELNQSPLFLARVERAIVFGSYLSKVDRLGDLDVAIEWQRREPDFAKHNAANTKRVTEEINKGRHFANMVEELYWWQREAELFLRNRKRGLSLHDYASEKEIIESVPRRVVFPK